MMVDHFREFFLPTLYRDDAQQCAKKFAFNCCDRLNDLEMITRYGFAMIIRLI